MTAAGFVLVVLLDVKSVGTNVPGVGCEFPLVLSNRRRSRLSLFTRHSHDASRTGRSSTARCAPQPDLESSTLGADSDTTCTHKVRKVYV